MQRGVANNYVHQAFDNQNGLMASYPLSQQTLRGSEYAYNGLPSSNHQPWKVTCGSTYSANESAPIYPAEDANQPAHSSNELPSSCGDTTFYPSYLLSTLTGGSQTKTRFPPAYSRSLSTGSQPTCFQNRPIRSDPPCFRTPCECVTSQNRSTWWNRKAHPTIRNFSPYQSPTSTGIQPRGQSSLAAHVRSPLLNHKMRLTSEQPPSWSGRKTAFAARAGEHCWNSRVCTNYQQVPAHGPYNPTANQQCSNAGYPNLIPFQSVNTGVHKDSIDYNMLEAGQQGEAMPILQRVSISAPQVLTGNHFMKHSHEDTLESVHGTMASGNTFCARVPGSMPASFLPTDAQRDSGLAFQNHLADSDYTYTEQIISDIYSQKNAQSSRKRKSPDVLRFLAELTSRELKSLIFAFEIMEKNKRRAEQVDLLSREVNVPQQSPAAVQSCQFTTHNTLCKDIGIIPQSSIDLVNECIDILESCPPSVPQRLQKGNGAEWKGDNLEISHVNHVSLNTSPTTYSNFKDLSEVSSLSDHCAQSRNMNSNPVFPRQGAQASTPHVVNHQHCHSLNEQTGPSLQAHEDNSACQDDAATSYFRAHCGAKANLQNDSFNGLKSSSKSLKTLASVSVNPNYLGSSQQNGRSNHYVQSLDAGNASDINQTDTPVLKTSASQQDEQSLKEIEALYDMLRTSYINKMSGHSKRQKVEVSSTTVQPSRSELGKINTPSVSSVQSPCDIHASQMIDCPDNWSPTAGSQNTTVVQQVAEFVNNEYLPHVSNSHSRAQERLNAEGAPSFEIICNDKNATPLKQSKGKTEQSLIRQQLTGSTGQVNRAISTSAPGSHPTEPAEIQKAGSSEVSGNLQIPDKMDITSSPPSVPGRQTAEVSECSATSRGFQKNSTSPFRSEELSRAQTSPANVGVPSSSAESNGQKNEVSVPSSEAVPEQPLVSPAPSSKVSGAQTDSISTSVHNQRHTGSHCGLSAGIHTKNKFPTTDACTTNDSKISKSSPDTVVEKLNSVSDPEILLTNDSDTLEFILRSLGIIPEDNEGQNATIVTSLSPGVTDVEQSMAVCFGGIELKQKAGITLPSSNTVTSIDRHLVAASLGPSIAAGCKATRHCSDVASLGAGEGQQVGTANAAVTAISADPTTPAAGKLNTDGVNPSSSLHRPSSRAESDEHPAVSVARSSAGDGWPSQAGGPPNVMADLVSASVPVGVGGCLKLEGNLADRPPCAEINRRHGTVAADTVPLEGEELRDESKPADGASYKENSFSICLNPSTLIGLVSTASTEPAMIEQVQEAQGSLSLSSAGSGNQLSNLLSLPSSSSCVHLTHLTRLLSTVASQSSVGSGGSYNRRALVTSSGTASPCDVPDITVCSVINTSNLSVVRYEKHVGNGLFDSHKGSSKQPNAVPQQETRSGTFKKMGMPISVSQDSQGRLMLNSEGFEKSVYSAQAVITSSTVGVENSPASDASASSSGDSITSDTLHAMQDVLPSRAGRYTGPALGIHSFPPSSNGEVSPGGLPVEQTQLAVAVPKNADTDLPSGIRITFVFSLSEYWEHWKVASSKNLDSNFLVTTGQELQRSLGKASQWEQPPNGISGQGPLGAASNLEENARGDLIAEMPPSLSLVPFPFETSIQFADASMFSMVANHSERVFCPEVDLTETPVGAKRVSEINALVSTNISKLLPGNVCYSETLTEANDTTGTHTEVSLLHCLNSKEVISQNFFSKNEFHSATELELTTGTESILRFWSPSEEDTASHHPNQETEKGLDFEHGLEWTHGGLELYNAAGAAELNKSIHKLSAMHHLHFGFTATVDGRQLHKENYHPKALCYRGAETIICEEQEPELMVSTPRPHLLTDENSMGNWTDPALSNALLGLCTPRAYLQNGSNQITNELETQVYEGNQAEAGETEIAVSALRLNSSENNPINSHDGHELINQDDQYPEGSIQPFSGQESFNEYEPNMDVSSEIKIKVLEHQELDNVLSELSNIIPNALILSAESKVADETSGEESPGANWETSRDCDNGHLGVGHEQMETSEIEHSSDTSDLAPQSLSSVGSSLQP
uniref:platelet binding protein GspB-like n=1 Tax=Pristiophorus japonicus TaxID=55135 RepID=UPI00398EB6C9